MYLTLNRTLKAVGRLRKLFRSQSIENALHVEQEVLAGTLQREVADEWLGFVANQYSHNAALIHDDVFRSCSLAAMVFMLSAVNKGLDTCPIGFNASSLGKDLGLPERYTPVLLIAIGIARQKAATRRARVAASDSLTLNEVPKP